MSCQCSILRSGASILTALWLLLGLSGLAKEEDLKLDSGPKAGEQAIPYHPLLSTDGAAGQRWCMVCVYPSEQGERHDYCFHTCAGRLGQ